MPSFPDPSHPHPEIQWPLPRDPVDGGAQERRQTNLRIAVLASGEGSNFEAMVASSRQGLPQGKVVLLLVNNPGCGAQQRAERLGVPCTVINHRHYASRDALDHALVQALENAAVDLVVMAGWMRIVTPVLIDAFPQRLVNIHPSLLPSFRGLEGAKQALQAGVTLAGCTAHLVTAEVDAGPILVQAAVPVLQGDDLQALSARIRVQEHRILPLAVEIAGQRLGLLD